MFSSSSVMRAPLAPVMPCSCMMPNATRAQWTQSVWLVKIYTADHWYQHSGWDEGNFTMYDDKLCFLCADNKLGFYVCLHGYRCSMWMLHIFVTGIQSKWRISSRHFCTIWNMLKCRTHCYIQGLALKRLSHYLRDNVDNGQDDGDHPHPPTCS